MGEKSKEHLTILLECDTVTTTPDLTPIFNHPKQGYVRLVKDHFKRSFLLEIFQSIKIKNKSDERETKDPIPCCSIELNKSLIKSQQVKQTSVVLVLSPGGVVRFKFKNDQGDKILNFFKEKLNECLEDTTFFPNENPVPAPKKDTTLKIAKPEEKKTIDTNNNKQVSKSDENALKYNENTNTSVIPKSNFYSCTPSRSSALDSFSSPKTESKSLNILKDIDSIKQQSPSSNSNKRRRENSLENQLDENSNQNTKNSNASSIITPKRNCSTKNLADKSNNNQFYQRFDLENQENDLQVASGNTQNSGSIKAWNRNNSMNKACGKGFSNLGNTCYMNAILQCLINIDVFANDLNNNYKLMKSLYSTTNIAQTASSSTIPLTSNSNLLQQSTTTTSNNTNDIEIDDLSSNNSKQQVCLYNCLCELKKATDTHNESLKVQSLKEIKDAISQEATRFLGHQQHDAHEFLCQVLDQLKDDVDKYNKKLKEGASANKEAITSPSSSSLSSLTELKQENMNKTNEIQYDSNNLTTNKDVTNNIKESTESLAISSDLNKNLVSTTTITTTSETLTNKKTITEISNPVVDNFQFEVTHAIHCKKCNNITTKNEEYNNLCLEMPIIRKIKDQNQASSTEEKQYQTVISLQDALDIFFQDESLNDFKCEKCENKEEVVIKRKFVKLPRILILHLKRYQFQDINANQSSTDQSAEPDQQVKTKQPQYRLYKNDSYVKIPRFLTLKFLTAEKPVLQLPKPIPVNLYNPARVMKPNLTDDQLNFNAFSLNGDNLPSLDKTQKLPLKPQSNNISNTNGKSTRQPLGASKTALNKIDENSIKNAGNYTSKPRAAKKLDTNYGDNNLPDISLLNTDKYNVQSYMIEDMNEEEQLKKAIEMSMSDDKLCTNSSIRHENEILKANCNEANYKYNKAIKSSDVSSNEPPSLTFEENSLSKNDKALQFLDGVNDAPWDISNTENENDLDSEYNFDVKKNTNMKTYERKAYGLRDRDKLKTRSNQITTKSDYKQDDYEMTEEEQTKKAIEESLASYKLDNPDYYFDDPFDEVSQDGKTKSNYKKSSSDIEIIENYCDKFEPLVKRSEADQKIIETNATTGTEPNSYRIIAIANHLGVSSNSGHYISDVYDLKNAKWFSYDDTKIETFTEEQVLQKRAKTGYIFFYHIHNATELQ